MATPEFVLRLREKVGHEHLWLSGVTMLVFDPSREHCLFVRRADNGAWTPVTGIIDPGEEPATAGKREVLEEAGVECEVLYLASVGSVGPMTYPNGDRASFLDVTFAAQWTHGDPHPADGENTEAAWFPVDQPPPLNGRFTRDFAAVLAQLAEGDHRARFQQ